MLSLFLENKKPKKKQSGVKLGEPSRHQPIRRATTEWSLATGEVPYDATLGQCLTGPRLSCRSQ